MIESTGFSVHLDKNDIAELNALITPQDSVKNIVKAAYLCSLASKYECPKKGDTTQEYTEFKKVLTVEKITALKLLDLTHLDSSNMTLVHEIMDIYSDNSSIKKVSLAAAELHKLVAKILESYSKVHEDIKKAKPVSKVADEKKEEEEKLVVSSTDANFKLITKVMVSEALKLTSPSDVFVKVFQVVGILLDHHEVSWHEL